MLYLPKQTTHKGSFLMKSITQDIKYYQAILSYADQHGVTKAAIKYRTYRQFIYRLRNRYDIYISIYCVINFLRHSLTSASYAILHLWLSGHF